MRKGAGGIYEVWVGNARGDPLRGRRRPYPSVRVEIRRLQFSGYLARIVMNRLAFV